jgi:hypothetical protein
LNSKAILLWNFIILFNKILSGDDQFYALHLPRLFLTGMALIGPTLPQPLVKQRQSNTYSPFASHVQN